MMNTEVKSKLSVKHLLGIKDLKQINDRLGRGAGDWAIRRVDERLRAFAALQLV